jgi:hypothetical protein
MRTDSPWRRRWARWFASEDHLDSADLRERVRAIGATPIDEAVNGERYVLAGIITSITVHPEGGTHGMDAELYDGTGQVRLIWLGRHRIPGIDPGRSLSVEGRLVTPRRGDLPTLFNPRYTLREGRT